MSKTSILIVEDEAIVAADLASILCLLGYEIKGTTPCGEEGISLAQELRPDVVLMDIRLAGVMDGMEAAEIIRRDFDLPVIFLTAHADHATLERAKRSEPFGYLLKPIEVPALETHIEMALYKHRAERKLRQAHDELELRVEERTRELREAEQRLREVNETLEQRVSERTAELKAANEKLHASRVEALHMMEDAVLSRRKAEEVSAQLMWAEKAIRENADKLRIFIEHAPAALAMFDTNMRYLSFSRRWRSDYGLGERDLIGTSHYDVFPEITEEWRDAHRRGLAGEVLRAEGDRFERADGSVRWVRWEIRPWYDVAGAIGGIVIFTEDVTEIKEAKEILSRYQLLAGHSRDIVLFVQRDDGRILEANTAAVNTYGYHREELLGLTIKELRAPESVGLTDVQMAEADTHGILFETVHHRRDGSAFPVEVSSQGATIGGTRTLISIIRDISKRKMAEHALRESETRFHSLFENMQEGFAFCRMLFDDQGLPQDFVYLDVNGAFGRLTGLEDVTGKKVTEVIPGIKESNPELFEAYGRVALTGGTDKFEVEVVPLGIWFSISVYSPQPEYFVAVFDNITERKRAEEALRGSEEQFRTLADAIPQLCWMANADGWIFWYNQRWYDYTGTTAEQMEGWGWQSVHDPDVLPEVVQRWQASIDSGDPFDMAFPLRGKDGELRPYLTRVLPLKDSAGRVQRWFGTNTDISDLKQAEEALLDNHRKLESMAIELSLAEERERDRIAGELHDQVGQRLIFGKMKLSALASQVQTDGCIQELEALDRIIDLSIQDIRSLTFQLRPPLLASAGLEAALRWLGEEFQEQHALLLSYSDDGQQKPMRYEIRSTVFQAAREMLLNTVKHAYATQIGINIWRGTNMLQLCLSDNGRGFDVAQARMKRSRSGGFGLINVQRRIEHLGGSIIIDSQPGSGTRVTIMMPLDTSQTGGSG